VGPRREKPTEVGTSEYITGLRVAKDAAAIAMHEYAIAQALVEQVGEIARKNRARAVTRVVVQVGKLRGVVPEILRWGFEIAAADSVAAGAALEIEEVPIRIQCRACGIESALDDPFYLCPSCGNPNIAQLAGAELILKSLEIDDGRNSGS